MHIEPACTQGGRWHSLSSTSSPTQTRPPKRGCGLVHDRRRVRTELVPQLPEQSDHGDQLVQPPCTAAYRWSDWNDILNGHSSQKWISQKYTRRVVYIYTVFQKKPSPLMFDNNFGKCRPILKIFHQVIRKKILYAYITKISMYTCHFR